MLYYMAPKQLRMLGHKKWYYEKHEFPQWSLHTRKELDRLNLVAGWEKHFTVVHTPMHNTVRFFGVRFANNPNRVEK